MTKSAITEPDAPRPLSVTLVFVGGSLAGLLLLLFPYSLDTESRRVLKLPEVQIWIGILAFQMGAWGLVLGPVIWTIQQLRGAARGNERRIAVTGGAYLILVLVPAVLPFLSSPHLIQNHVGKVAIASLIGSAIGILGVLAILLVDEAIRRDFAQVPSTDSFARYFELRAHLFRLRFLLGVQIALAMLSAGALRNALIASEKPAVAPVAVLAYGGYFTMLFALAYVPTYLQLVRAGRRLVEGLIEPLKPTLEGIAKYQKERAAAEDSLQLRVTAWENLKGGLVILSPIVAALTSLVLGFAIT